MTKVFVTQALPGGVEINGADVVVAPDGLNSDRAALLAMLGEHAPIDVLVCIAWDRVDAEFLDACGESLRGVCQYAVGYDNIDLHECNVRGITVTNTPDGVTEGTADMAWALMMAAGRRIGEGDRYVRSGQFTKDGPLAMTDYLGVDFTGATLLIVGAGRIGYATAIRSLPWKMRVQYVARSRHLEFERAPLHGERVELDVGLRNADFVSVHTPLTEDTRHLINAERLAKMKSSAVLVNTSRGPVVEEAALVQALRGGLIFGAGLDVYEDEPQLSEGLAELENVVLMPHCGSGSKGSRLLMTRMVRNNVEAILRHRAVPNEVRVSAHHGEGGELVRD
ncbi:MAG: 2-hydroxyacid dehydrogenase [Planctomycetota bacterium]|jgi:glyoxylate reductase